MLQLNPLTIKKIKRFRSIKRGYYAFILFTTLIALALCAELLINSRALVVSYEGKLHFPTYGNMIPGKEFGLDYNYETNYRELQSQFKKEDQGNWVIMPLVPFNPYEQDYSQEGYPPHAPSFESGHYLGTDTTGRDVLARITYGFRIAIAFSLAVMLGTWAMGISIGMAMGYVGGKFDLFFQRFIEVWAMMPFLFVIMILVSLTEASLPLFIAINVALGWVGMTYYMRALTYKEKEREYVMAAEALGAKTSRILFKHILPNTMVMMITLAPFAIVGGIGALTSLDFLGFGLKAPTPSWGELIKQGTDNMDKPWIISSVITATVAILMMVSFVGEGIRDAFDPKKYTRYE